LVAIKVHNSQDIQKLAASERLAVVILAAGQSSRLGHAKQLVMLNNQTLIERQCKLATSVTSHVVCVLGALIDDIAPLISSINAPQDIQLVENKNWQHGMSSSIAAGIAALPTHIEAAMIVLVDQWQLTRSDLNNLVSHWQKNKNNIAIASSTQKQTNEGEYTNTKYLGPPVIFPAKYFNELRSLTGESGAKPVIKKYFQSLSKVEISRAQADLDTPEQLKAMQQSLS